MQQPHGQQPRRGCLPTLELKIKFQNMPGEVLETATFLGNSTVGEMRSTLKQRQGRHILKLLQEPQAPIRNSTSAVSLQTEKCETEKCE